MMELTLDGGKLWTVTPDHRFLLLRGGSAKVWVVAKEIIAGDHLIIYDPTSKSESLVRVMKVTEAV